jgi:hypothetical protein
MGGFPSPFGLLEVPLAPIKPVPTPKFGTPGCDICDPLSDCFDETQPCGPTGVGIQGAAGVNIKLAITDNIAIPDTVFSTVSDAVTSAINGTLSNVEAGLSSVTSGITSGLQSITTNLDNFVNSAYNNLQATLQTLLNVLTSTLTNAFNTVGNNIAGAINGGISVLRAIATAIGGLIAPLIKEIHDTFAGGIQPILSTIASHIGLIVGIIQAISTDIHLGVGALVLLPQQLAASLSTLTTGIQQASKQLNFEEGATIGTDVHFPELQIPVDLFANFNGLLKIVEKSAQYATLPLDLKELTTNCVSPRMQKILDNLNAVGTNEYQWFKVLSDYFYTALIWLAQAVGELKQIAKLGDEEANKYCQLETIDPATAAEALLRGFIDPGYYQDQLIKQGWPLKNQGIFQSLAQLKIDPQLVVEHMYRSDVPWESLVPLLSKIGMTDTAINYMREAADVLPSLQELLRWKDFHEIPDDVFNRAAARIRRTPDDIAHILATYRTRETLQSAITGQGRVAAAATGQLGATVTSEPPQAVFDAAERDQVDADFARAQWLSHWSLPSYVLTLQSDFRHLAGLSGVIGAILAGDIAALTDPTLGFERTKAAMQAENVPPEWWADLIQLARPLIPFRSIPAYVKAGVMSTTEGVVELLGHGFDPQRIKWILDYANKATTKTTATVVAGISSLSVATARTLFDDGAISRDQYVSVLEAHKFPHDVAELQADADQAAFHAKERKQTIADYIDEVAAGVLTVDDALSQLHQQGYTVAEVARFQKAVKKSTVTSIKHPTNADLKAFLKAQVITLAQYKAELEAQGWGDPWLSAFVALETPPAS